MTYGSTWYRSLFTHLMLIVIGSFFIMPLVVVFFTALKPGPELYILPPKLLPNVYQWSNFKEAVMTIPFVKYTLNSLFIALFVVVGSVVSASLVGYAFARLQWKGRNFFFAVLIATMILPGQVTMIPLFVVFKQIGWLNTYYPLIVPAFTGSAFNIFLLRQFSRTIPQELSDSGKIDGANEFRIYWDIILPLTKPALAVIAIFAFMNTWNDFYGPLIYLNDKNLSTLALGLREFQQLHGVTWNLLLAASLIAIIPSLVLFFAFQRYFVEGITLTGIKG